MKKLTAILFAFVLCLGMIAFSSCTDTKDSNTGKSDKASTDNSAANTKADAAKTTDKKELIVGIDDKFPPMGFRDEKNEIVGFDIDLAREAITRMGYTPVFQPINWNNKTLELNKGTIDFIWNGFTITDERKKEVLFSKPYLANAQVVLIKADSSIKEKSDLKDKKVAAQTDSSGLEALNADKDITSIMSGKPVEYADYVSALNDLKIGRIDAIVLDLVVADYYMSKQSGTYKMMSEQLAPEQYGVGVKKGNEKLLTSLQKALDGMSEDGKSGEISKKWFGSDKVLK